VLLKHGMKRLRETDLTLVEYTAMCKTSSSGHDLCRMKMPSLRETQCAVIDYNMKRMREMASTGCLSSVMHDFVECETIVERAYLGIMQSLESEVVAQHNKVARIATSYATTATPYRYELVKGGDDGETTATATHLDVLRDKRLEVELFDVSQQRERDRDNIQKWRTALTPQKPRNQYQHFCLSTDKHGNISSFDLISENDDRRGVVTNRPYTVVDDNNRSFWRGQCSRTVTTIILPGILRVLKQMAKNASEPDSPHCGDTAVMRTVLQYLSTSTDAYRAVINSPKLWRRLFTNVSEVGRAVRHRNLSCMAELPELLPHTLQRIIMLDELARRERRQMVKLLSDYGKPAAYSKKSQPLMQIFLLPRLTRHAKFGEDEEEIAKRYDTLRTNMMSMRKPLIRLLCTCFDDIRANINPLI
jgi:hypothetical protein